MAMPPNIDLTGALSGLSALVQSSVNGQSQNAGGGQSNPINSILSFPTSLMGTALQTLQGLPLVGFMFSG